MVVADMCVSSPAVPSPQGILGCLCLFGVVDTFLVRNEEFIPGTSSIPQAKQSLRAPALPPRHVLSTRHQAVSLKLSEVHPTSNSPLFPSTFSSYLPLRGEVAVGFEAP